MNPHGITPRPLPDAADLAEFNAGVRFAALAYAAETERAPKVTGQPRRPCRGGCGRRTRRGVCRACETTTRGSE